MNSSALKTGNAVSEARPKKSLIREYAEALAIAFVLALVIKFFLFQAFSIPSGSMENTLLIGDYLLVNKLSYGIRSPLDNKVIIPIGKPQRGDVVVFIFPKDPSKDYIKRVIGLPGDRLQIINKKVFINGKEYITPQAVFQDSDKTNEFLPGDQVARDNFGPVVVPADSYFCMGDNRDRSYDSRFWGFVPMDNLRGRAMIIYFSWAGNHHDGFFPALVGGVSGLVHNFSWNCQQFQMRWNRLGMVIH
jgi:signal peptidase I